VSPPRPSPPPSAPVGDRPGLLIAHVGPADPIDEGDALAAAMPARARAGIA